MKSPYKLSAKLQAVLLSVGALAVVAVVPVQAAIRQCLPVESGLKADRASRSEAEMPYLLGSPAATGQVTEQGAGPVTNDGKVVRIESGQYLICMDGDRSDQSFVTMPFLMVRASNARLLVQVSERLCQVTVLSGSAVIKNLLEHHIVELHKGTVYASELRSGSAPAAFAGVAEPAHWMALFQTVKCRTMISTVSPTVLQEGPFAKLLNQQDLAQPSGKALCATLIVSPPTVLNYEIGDQVAKLMPLSPVLRQHFAPSGIVPSSNSQLVAQQDAAADGGSPQ